VISVTRFFVLVAFAFWQGGFAFYTAVVVPIGTDVLGSSFAQGMITRQVAFWINVTGAVALGIMFMDSFVTKPGRVGRGLLILYMAAILIGQFVLHQRLDEMIDLETGVVYERLTFRWWHRVYLWLSTAQWAGAVVWLGFTVAVWRRSDCGK
jgi:hypothetical protein